MVEIVYSSSLTSSDPSDRSVTILGKKANLLKLHFSDVSPFLGSNVSHKVSKLIKPPTNSAVEVQPSTELRVLKSLKCIAVYCKYSGDNSCMYIFSVLQTWSAALGTLREDGGSCSLWLTSASVAALPTKFSRHNTPSQAHSITELVQSERKKGKQTLIIVSFPTVKCADRKLQQLIIQISLVIVSDSMSSNRWCVREEKCWPQAVQWLELSPPTPARLPQLLPRLSLLDSSWWGMEPPLLQMTTSSVSQQSVKVDRVSP